MSIAIEELAPRRPLWQAVLLGMLPPLGAALLIWLALDTLMWERGDPTGIGWLQRIAAEFGQLVLAFASIQLLLAAFMSLVERRDVQPPAIWLLGGAIATTPLVLYLCWPNIPINPTGILFVYGFGMAAAAITRYLRHGGHWA